MHSGSAALQQSIREALFCKTLSTPGWYRDDMRRKPKAVMEFLSFSCMPCRLPVWLHPPASVPQTPSGFPVDPDVKMTYATCCCSGILDGAGVTASAAACALAAMPAHE